jgi:hypothetical protein
VKVRCDVKGVNSDFGTKRAVARHSWSTILGRPGIAPSVAVTVPAVIVDFVINPIAQAIIRLVWCFAVLVGAYIWPEISQDMRSYWSKLSLISLSML